MPEDSAKTDPAVEALLDLLVEYMMEKYGKVKPADEAMIQEIRMRIATGYGMDADKKKGAA